jgi:hypothetical protein
VGRERRGGGPIARPCGKPKGRLPSSRSHAFFRGRMEAVIVRNMSDFRENDIGSPLIQKKPPRSFGTPTIRPGDVVLRRHRAYSTKKRLLEPSPEKLKAKSLDRRAIEDRTRVFRFERSASPASTACVLSFDAKSLYRPCFERNWRKPKFVSFRAKKYAFAMRARRKSTHRQREAESSARRQKFVMRRP